MTAKIITELITSAAYIRMSSDQQADSPERQRRQIEEYATRNGYRIVKWYSDHGISGTESRTRAGYQQLLADTPSGLFSAVLITEQSRMSREDLFSVFPQWGVFRDAGVKLVSVQSGPIDFGSLGGIITALVNQYSSHDEIRKLADRTVSGKINLAMQGYRIGGTVVFAFDREIVDRQGNVLKQVSFRERFKGSPDTRTRLVPSAETEAVEAVRWAFEHVKDGGTLGFAAAELNRRGLRSCHGRHFSSNTLAGILTNPVYIGTTRSGFNCCGKFRKMTDTHEPIVRENTHQGIIDKDTFDAVCSIVANKGTKRATWRRYLLSGMCRCGHCGYAMSGQTHVKKKPGKQSYYFCPGHRPYIGAGATCDAHPSFQTIPVERAVLRAWCDVFMGDAAAEQLKTKPASSERPAIEQQQLKAVREQIERAEKNLLLAQDADDFQTVSSGLKALRKREAELLETIGRASRKLSDLPPDILGVVAKLKTLRKHLDKWPNIGTPKQREALLCELIPVMRQTIKSVVLRSDVDEKLSAIRGTTVKRRSGVVTFNPEHVSAPDVVLTDDMLASSYFRGYRGVVDFLREIGKPQTEQDIARQFRECGVRHGSFDKAIRCCEAEGRIRETKDGWIVADE